jgi:hypothetical protein
LGIRAKATKPRVLYMGVAFACAEQEVATSMGLVWAWLPEAGLNCWIEIPDVQGSEPTEALSKIKFALQKYFYLFPN